MDAAKENLVQHLFAECAALLEDAHELAAKGQADGLPERTLRTLACALSGYAKRSTTLAAAIDAILDPPKSKKPVGRTKR